MLDLALTGFVLLILAMGTRRPFVWVLAYLYIDIVSPQKITYHMLNSIPISLIAFILAVVGWLAFDRKDGVHFTFRQALILLLLIYCGITTQTADFPQDAADKWAWVWKSLVFAMFLPFTLRTRLRVEAAALIMCLSAGSIVICGAIKTLLGGGGYGMLRLFVNDNTGLYEGSTISLLAIAIIPLIQWLARHGTIFPPEKRTRLFANALSFACLLIPIGTEERTGLICAAMLGVILLRSVKNKGLYIAGTAVALLIAVPLLPATYTMRMDTIKNNQSDQSAATRLAMWKWTLGYAADHPFGGGFASNLGSHIKIVLTNSESSGNTTAVEKTVITDDQRAFHSSYFEMLGEQGWPGLILWLILNFGGMFQLEATRRKLKGSDDPRDRSDAALATALQQGHLCYLVGAAFVGIAYQPFVYSLIGLQIGLNQLVTARVNARKPKAERKMVVPAGERAGTAGSYPPAAAGAYAPAVSKPASGRPGMVLPTRPTN